MEAERAKLEDSEVDFEKEKYEVEVEKQHIQDLEAELEAIRHEHPDEDLTTEEQELVNKRKNLKERVVVEKRRRYIFEEARMHLEQEKEGLHVLKQDLKRSLHELEVETEELKAVQADLEARRKVILEERKKLERSVSQIQCLLIGSEDSFDDLIKTDSIKVCHTLQLIYMQSSTHSIEATLLEIIILTGDLYLIAIKKLREIIHH